jgi:RNA polymerase sigma-70 factor (ECF subfamily)
MSADGLSQTTIWATITTAHTAGPEGQRAMHELVSRYHDAVERYIRLKIRDRHLADEVIQEFWHKVLTHKLSGADQSKGRFRDYVRTVLHRLVIDHFRTRKLQALPLGELLDPSRPDSDYDRVWRDVVIKRVLARLDTFEIQTPKNRYATVLNLRLKNPDASIEELTERINAQSEHSTTPEAFRKTLQRARAKFLELLILELKETIHPATPEDIEAEIYDLGLGYWYRRYSSESRT